MMPQQEAGEPIQGQSSPTYGRYEENQSYAYDPSYQQPTQDRAADKVYAPPVAGNKNFAILTAFGMSLVALIVLAVICLIAVGGSAGWISFCAASLAIFIIGAVAIDKIK